MNLKPDPPINGQPYYDLSRHTMKEATETEIALIEYNPIPCRMPDGTWVYPSR